MKKRYLKRALLCLLSFLLLLIAFNGVSDGHVIVIDGCHIVSMFNDTPPDYSAYLYDAVINSGVYANLINEALGPIEAFTWSRDVGDTYVSVNRLSARLEEISNLCIEQNKPFVILSHSWGTVLAYLALKKNPNIHVDKLITMGSPLDSITPGVWELTHNYVQDFIYFDHFKLPYINEWKNYWAVYDWISGSIPGTSNIQITSSFFDVLGVTIPSIHAAYYDDFVVWENILRDVLDSKTILLNGPCAVKVLDTAKYFSNIILNGVSIVKWEWDLDYNGITFNPDPSYNKRQISYTFREFRNRTVAVRVTDNNGNQTVATQDVQVTQYPFTVTGSWELLTRSFSFDDPSLTSLIRSWTWDFGDGNPIDPRHDPSHDYANSGFYTVTLTLKLDDGSEIQSWENIYVGPGTRIIQGHTITGQETWYSGGTYVIQGPITVVQGGTLTVESGAKIQLYGGVTIRVFGTLKATGATFTWADDNNPWRGISFVGAGSNGSLLDNCDIKHTTGINWWSNQSQNPTVLYIEDASPTINNCKIHESSAANGIFLNSNTSNCSPSITNCAIDGFLNGYGVAIDLDGFFYWSLSSPAVLRNTITNNAAGIGFKNSGSIIKSNNFLSNRDADLYFKGENINGTMNWDEIGIYRVSSLNLSKESSLNIPSGKVIKIDSGGRFYVEGTLKATGATFTWADDNNPWRGISFVGAGSNGSLLDNCDIKHTTGINWWSHQSQNLSVLYIEDASPTINNCKIHDSSALNGIFLLSNQSTCSPPITNCSIDGFLNGCGISIDLDGFFYWSLSSPNITGNTITNNDRGIGCKGGGIYHDNKVTANISYGMINYANKTLNASNNDWGHPSGPLDNSDDRASGGLFNPNGLGNKVSDNINYYPWIGCTVGPTATPSGFKASTETTTINLSWNTNTEPDLEGYIISYGTAPGSYQASILIGKVTSYELTGLTNGQKYYLAISSLNTVGAQSTKRQISATLGQAKQVVIAPILYLLLE